MNIIVHYPKSKQEFNVLQNKITDVHIEAVTNYINKLTCPKEQKLQLLNSIKDYLDFNYE